MADRLEPIVTDEFRLAFPYVFEAQVNKQSPNAKPKFSVTMLFPKDKPALLLPIRKLLHAAALAKFGHDKNKWPGLLKTMDMSKYISMTGKDGWPLRDGDTVTWEGFAGHFFLRAASDYQPGIVNARVQDILDKSAVFGGLIARAHINAYGYSNSGNHGVSVGLNNLQILRDDGTRFSGRMAASKAFTPVDTGEDDPGMYDSGFGAAPEASSEAW